MMADFDRKHMESVYRLFDTFALADQRNYYRSALNKYRTSASQINGIRAFFSLLTGLASALAGLLVQSLLVSGGTCSVNPLPADMVVYCDRARLAIAFLMMLAVVAPAVGGAFHTLGDLYQWDRTVTIYDAALENIDVADARSPDPDMDDLTYRASLRAYTEGTLAVMRDETAQWGQLIRTPPQLEQFVEEETTKAEKVTGDRPDNLPAANQPAASAPTTPAAPTSPSVTTSTSNSTTTSSESSESDAAG